MKRLLTLLFTATLFAALPVAAQKRTTQATLYSSFRPSVITLADGRQLRQSFTNISLKNGALLYLQGELAMEANMDNVAAVKFDERSFVKIGSQLACLVDTVGTSGLYCIELLDLESYKRNLRNNVNFSNIELGDQISTSTVDMNNEEDRKLPVFHHYYYRIGSDFVKVHERTLKSRLSKEQRTMMDRIVSLPDFSWQKEQSLLMLLKAITRP